MNKSQASLVTEFYKGTVIYWNYPNYFFIVPKLVKIFSTTKFKYLLLYV